LGCSALEEEKELYRQTAWIETSKKSIGISRYTIISLVSATIEGRTIS
jgi:hypothetical protein